MATRECYLASLGSENQQHTVVVEERRTLVEPSEELEDVQLDDECPEKTTKIGTKLHLQIKQTLIHFLKNNKDIFAWSHGDMLGINLEVISYWLNIDPSCHPIK